MVAFVGPYPILGLTLQMRLLVTQRRTRNFLRDELSWGKKKKKVELLTLTFLSLQKSHF